MENGVPTPSGKKKWQPGTIMSILQNEKDKGDAMLQETFTGDFLTKKKKVNEGGIPQVGILTAEAIITAERLIGKALDSRPLICLK